MSSIPPNEGDAYREQLNAALSRVDALEAELAAREGETGALAPNPRETELERLRLEVIESCRPGNIRSAAVRRVLFTTGLTSTVALIMWLSGYRESSFTLVVVAGMGLAIGGLIGLVEVVTGPASLRMSLAKIDAELAEVRRVHALETEVRETRRQRVSMDPAQARVAAPLEETMDPDAPSAERWREK